MRAIGPFLLVTLLTQSFFCACNKPDDQAQACVAGSGGSVPVRIDAKHHGRAVRPLRLFVKYDAVDAPPDASQYDLNLNVDTAMSVVRMPGLKCGNYYVFLVAYDSAVKSEVKGGISFPINEGEKNEVPVEVAVTE